MRVEVDTTKCEAAGYCQRLASHIFVVGNEHAEVIKPIVEGDDARLAQEAINLCPTRAIAVRIVETTVSDQLGD
jgi:ferredoxin